MKVMSSGGDFMVEEFYRPIRIGYIDGQPKRVNERIVDGQWVKYLGEYTELVKIPPIQIYKLFGGTISQWLKKFPQSLLQLSERLEKLCRKYQIQTIYMNLPSVIPYFLMARNYGGLDLGLLFITHSVGSEFWLKQWVAIAPWITKRDVLLASTETSKKALLQISDRYQLAKHIPLCIAMAEQGNTAISSNRKGKKLLSIGRIEDVKNIELLLESFAVMREQIPGLTLTVAGEFTGSSNEQIELYQQALGLMKQRLKLEDSIDFPGAVVGTEKESLFLNSDLLINLSTDPGETFGFNLIEAKVWGLPTVCANWDGFQEIVEHEGDGYFIDCIWEGGFPELDKQQIISHCMCLLQDSTVFNNFSKRSIELANKYDYRTVIPRIVTAIQEAEHYKIAAEPETATVAMSTASDLLHIFHLEHLKHIPFLHDRLIDIPSSENMTALKSWMPIVKPIIHHFAGRYEYAKL
jgi:glycosyltransferase involved in cell wall biosynthesis